jgi:dihydroxy-acid dehydratase
LGLEGDEIALDARRPPHPLGVRHDELNRRRAAWTTRTPHYERGYGRLFLEHVLQANEGCEFEFLRGKTPVGAEDTAGPSHS